MIDDWLNCILSNTLPNQSPSKLLNGVLDNALSMVTRVGGVWLAVLTGPVRASPGWGPAGRAPRQGSGFPSPGRGSETQSWGVTAARTACLHEGVTHTHTFNTFFLFKEAGSSSLPGEAKHTSTNGSRHKQRSSVQQVRRWGPLTFPHESFWFSVRLCTLPPHAPSLFTSDENKTNKMADWKTLFYPGKEGWQWNINNLV